MRSASSRNPAVISRRIKHRTWTESQLTFPASGLNDIPQVEPFLTGDNAALLHADFFGQDDRFSFPAGEMQGRGISGPATTLLLDAEIGGGLQLGTLSGVESIPLYDGDRMIGRFFEDADAKYCFLGDVQPGNPAAPRSEQTEQVLETIHEVLTGVGMHFRDVVRTWFYNDRILDWYDDFNRVRTVFFEQHGIIRMPASTGIGAPNSAGTALVAKAIAVLPKTGNVLIKRVHSPLQCEAPSYGSAFSRAMEVSDLSVRKLYVSGTASIEPAGKTVHAGNAAGQIEKTMEVVNALLVEADMDFSDVTRAIAYFRHADDISLWYDYCRKRQLPPLPVIFMPSDICRDDLLFEIELDAAVEQPK